MEWSPDKYENYNNIIKLAEREKDTNTDIPLKHEDQQNTCRQSKRDEVPKIPLKKTNHPSYKSMSVSYPNNGGVRFY